MKNIKCKKCSMVFELYSPCVVTCGCGVVYMWDGKTLRKYIKK
jgi:hypothetical protein